MAENLRNIQLPEELCRAAEQRYSRRFSSIEDLLTFILNELLTDEAAQLDLKEQQMIEQRLKDLGYV